MRLAICDSTSSSRPVLAVLPKLSASGSTLAIPAPPLSQPLLRCRLCVTGRRGKLSAADRVVRPGGHNNLTSNQPDQRTSHQVTTRDGGGWHYWQGWYLC